MEQLAKRNKPTPAQGSKRSADQPVDVLEQEHNANAGLPEVICGLRTLHDIPIAGYPEWGRLDEIPAYDERTGVPPSSGKGEKSTRKRARQNGGAPSEGEHHLGQSQRAWTQDCEVTMGRWLESVAR